MEEKFFKELIEKVQSYFENGGSHGFDHTERVLNLSLKISEEVKGIDLDVVKAAAILHDIARLMEDKGKISCHAEEGAKLAKEILEKTNFPREKIEKVCYSIKVHRHSSNITPETKEAEILQDADRLDALGAITIARMFSTGGKMERPLYKPEIPFGDVKKGYDCDSTIHGFYGKILKIKPETFKTAKAKKIAKHRYKIVEDFLTEFKKEWAGEL